MGGDVAAALGVVASQLEAVLESNQRLEAEVAALHSEVEAVRAFPASERPAAVERGGGAADSTGAAPGAAEGSADGPVVRVVRWLERRLRGRGSS